LMKQSGSIKLSLRILVILLFLYGTWHWSICLDGFVICYCIWVIAKMQLPKARRDFFIDADSYFYFALFKS
jgi:hypothetical protein